MRSRRISRLTLLFSAVVSVVCLWATAFKLKLSPDVADLFPSRGDAAVMTRFTRLFSNGDLAMLLVRATSAEEARNSSEQLVRELSHSPAVINAIDRIPTIHLPDPTLAWALAGPIAREKLADALTPEAVRARLQETRELLLAPGSGALEDEIARDPLRLSLIPFEARREVAAGASTANGEFVADEGRARLVLVEPRGSAFSSADVHAFIHDVSKAIDRVHVAHPDVRIDLTGGHAIANATERMMETDLVFSGTLSTLLAAASFALLFRRKRALAAVLPPLALGTLWTTGLASLWPHGISTIAVGFMSVVVGVGVDTGVHVYAALLEGRRLGLPPAEAASYARKKTAAPTFIAAALAAAAFGSLALSEIDALGQLGILCGTGELLTAVAIQLFTPAIGSWMERGAPPEKKPQRWVEWVHAATRSPSRARMCIAGVVGFVSLAFVIGWPRPADTVVAVRPSEIEPLRTQNEIYKLFGGRPGQWVVLSSDRDAGRARERADALFEALEPLARDHVIDGYDSLTTFAPSEKTQRRRLAIRDSLNLPAATDRLQNELVSAGFDPDAFAPALDSLRHPSEQPITWPADASPEASSIWKTLASRHMRSHGGETVVVTYVRPTGVPAADEQARRAIQAADPAAVITGFSELERGLKSSLTHDLPRIALAATLLVAIVLRASFGSMQKVLLALFALAAELGILAVVMRAIDIRWHVYDALVLPVLIGITMDETMFLLFASRHTKLADAIREQAPLVASTALTTASGFAALIVCRFTGLRDLGAVGALGSVFGLFASLIVLPAALQLVRAQTGQRPVATGRD